MNTSTPLKGGSNIIGFQIKRTAGTYKYTLLAENNEGNDSKTFEVTVLGKDSMLLNFIHSFCFATVFITGNLRPFGFVNNTNLPKYNIGNSVSPLINKWKWKFFINTVLMHISKCTAFVKNCPYQLSYSCAIDFADCKHWCRSEGSITSSGKVTNKHNCRESNITHNWKCIPTTTTEL